MPHNPSRLRVLEQATSLADDLHRLLDQQYDQVAHTSPGVRVSLLRAVDAIPAAILDAASQRSTTRTVTLLLAAASHCNDVERQLHLASALGALDAGADRLLLRVQAVRRQLYGFKRYLETRADERAAARGRPRVDFAAADRAAAERATADRAAADAAVAAPTDGAAAEPSG
ncbi:MAG: four helix bundle protein [Gemmatimonadetes bacterium]|nr:four helix bundle protein [Gemmatimonadota bacterium]